MKTRRFALDRHQNKIFIGSLVRYDNKIFLVEEIEYLSWSINQYLMLTDKKNKNKKIRFISPDNVKVMNVL